jgi:hypothetical protein
MAFALGCLGHGVREEMDLKEWNRSWFVNEEINNLECMKGLKK